MTTSKPVVTVPQNLEEATKLLAEIGETQRRNQELQTEMNQRIAEITAQYTDRVAEEEKREKEQRRVLQVYAEGHRRELTKGEKTKCVSVVTGKFGWRFNPEVVTIKKPKDVLAFCQGDSEFSCFVHQTPTLASKDELKKNKELAQRIPGVEFIREEGFYAEPAKAPEEVSQVPEK